MHAETLVGLDPLDPVAVWERLYVGTAMTGRRGAAVHALGALDVALWDICGKAAGKPTWQLLGEAAHESLTPYASLLPHARDIDSFQQALVDQAAWAKGLGFRAAKLELLWTGPYASTGLDEPDTRMVETIAAARKVVGPDFAIMVDVGYSWDSPAHALELSRAGRSTTCFFVETPLWAAGGGAPRPPLTG